MNRVDQFLNNGAAMIETAEIKELREKVEKASSMMQVASIAGIVVSVATLFFSLLIGSVIFTPILAGISILGIVLCADGFKASKNASEIASKPTNFVALHILNEEDKMKHYQTLVLKALEGTLLLHSLAKMAQ